MSPMPDSKITVITVQLRLKARVEADLSPCDGFDENNDFQ